MDLCHVHCQDISPETAFIFVSGQMGDELAVEILKKGSTGHVLKPF